MTNSGRRAFHLLVIIHLFILIFIIFVVFFVFNAIVTKRWFLTRMAGISAGKIYKISSR